jgi:hypothetical protein
VAGYWMALRGAALGAWRVLAPRAADAAVDGAPRPGRTALLVAGFLVAIIPGFVLEFARYDAEPIAELYNLPWPDEPEAIAFLVENIGQAAGAPVRGSLHFARFDEETVPTLAALWARGVASIAEYSQLVTPQAFYFEHKVFDQNVTGSLNGFVPMVGASGERFWRTLQMFGTRYYISSDPRMIPLGHGGHTVELPHRPHGGKPGTWHIVVLPRPNVGDYSPIEVTTAGSASEIVAKMRAPGFDFTGQAVLSAPLAEPLVAARDIRLSRRRGALHLSGHSDGTSLVVLPQQFSNCLRARDPRARIVRTNLMMTGVIFSGSVNTDIVFDYGLFSPGCRRVDLADMKRLDLRIDLRMPHLTVGPRLPDWRVAAATLRGAAGQIR